MFVKTYGIGSRASPALEDKSVPDLFYPTSSTDDSGSGGESPVSSSLELLSASNRSSAASDTCQSNNISIVKTRLNQTETVRLRYVAKRFAEY